MTINIFNYMTDQDAQYIMTLAEQLVEDTGCSVEDAVELIITELHHGGENSDDVSVENTEETDGDNDASTEDSVWGDDNDFFDDSEDNDSTPGEPEAKPEVLEVKPPAPPAINAPIKMKLKLKVNE